MRFVRSFNAGRIIPGGTGRRSRRRASDSARLKHIAKRTLGLLYVHGRWLAVLLGASGMVLPVVVHHEGKDGTGRDHSAEEDVQEPCEAAAS